jgi:hypothetical protein
MRALTHFDHELTTSPGSGPTKRVAPWAPEEAFAQEQNERASGMALCAQVT